MDLSPRHFSGGATRVVPGTGIDTVLVRGLQDGNPSGYVRQALAASPCPGLVSRPIVKRFYHDPPRQPNQPSAQTGQAAAVRLILRRVDCGARRSGTASVLLPRRGTLAGE